MVMVVLERLSRQQQRYLGRPVLVRLSVVMVVVTMVMVPAYGHRAHVRRRIVRSRRVLVVDLHVLDRLRAAAATADAVRSMVVVVMMQYGPGQLLLEMLVEQKLRWRRRAHQFRVRGRGVAGRRRSARVRRRRVKLLLLLLLRRWRNQSDSGL